MNRKSGTLFGKYAWTLAALVAAALLASAAVEGVFGYRETRALVEQLQREKARGAALRIEQFADSLQRELEAALVHQSVALGDMQRHRFDLHRLLRQNPAITDLTWVDAAGMRQLAVSRATRDLVGPGDDWSDHPGVIAGLAGRPYFSAVHLRNESEPFATLAAGSERGSTGVLLAEVNLRFVSDVVAEIEVGAAGAAYVVDGTGRLVSHPDFGLVLRGTELADFAPVRSGLAGAAPDVVTTPTAVSGSAGRHVTARAAIPSLGLHVFVEQPLAEAFAPLYALLLRSGVLLAGGLVLAAVAARLLARRMARPIAALHAGAERLGEGRLDERVEVKTGDELEALADEFNRMAERLHESRAGLERKVEQRTRALALANQSKSRFLAAASHDLRQPVHALGLYIAQLRDATSAAARERLIGKIEASSSAVSELIEALLDLSKLDAGAVAPQPVAFAVQDLLNRLEDGFAPAARAKGLRLRVRPSRLRIATDPMLLERIVWNLAANALRYTRDGGMLIACRARAGVARFEVWDTGIGIPPAQQARVFEEFYQAHATDSAATKGLGLGLAIVERLAALLGLRVTMASVSGRGSMFAVEVPLAAAQTAAAAPHLSTQALRDESGLALVVDDDAEAREAAAGLLASWGWRVIAAAGPDEALAALGTQRPDVILADQHLSDGALGTELVARVRALCGAPVPALLVSGDVTAELRELASDAGLHLLHKPLQAARLRTLLHHLRHGEAADEAADKALDRAA